MSVTELDLYRDATNSWSSIARAALNALEEVDPQSSILAQLRDAETEVNDLMRRGLADLLSGFDAHADTAMAVTA